MIFFYIYLYIGVMPSVCVGGGGRVCGGEACMCGEGGEVFVDMKLELSKNVCENDKKMIE